MTIFVGAARTRRAARAETREDAALAAANATTDLERLTCAQLRELCAERGIEAPSKASKAKLLELLGG